jgi:hypothetical protein
MIFLNHFCTHDKIFGPCPTDEAHLRRQGIKAIGDAEA